MNVPSDRALLFGVLAAPLAWAAQLGAQYTLAAPACGSPLELVIHGVTIIALAIAVAGLLVARRAHGRIHAIDPSADLDETTVHRSRALAYAGLLASAFFLVVIAVQGIPALLIDPCQ